jgi:hypothetical protein
MGLIREPKGVDFIIKSRSLSKKDEERLSAFIRASKIKNKQVKTRKLKRASHPKKKNTL